MTSPPPTAGTATIRQVVPLPAERLRRVVAVLCTTQTVGYGVLFYAFPVLAPTISDTQDWSLPTLVAVFTLAQLVAAAAGLWVGRHLDRHGPRRVMAGGSFLGVAATVTVAVAPNLVVFTGAWVLAGLAMSATFYPAAFATATHWAGTQRVKALTSITLVAGFASTIFAPLSALLNTHGGWRETYLLLAVALAVTVPMHWWGLGDPWQTHGYTNNGDRVSAVEDPAPGSRLNVLRQAEFVMLTLAFTIAAFCVYAVLINLVPLLTENGLTTTQAAAALGVGGAGQVAGRLIYGPVLTKLAVRSRTITVLAATSLTTLAIAVFSGSLVLACLTSFFAGTARGILTLIEATAISDRWGTTAYGARNSVLSGALMTAAALAPWGGAAVASALGDYSDAFILLAAAVAVSTLLVRPKRTKSGGGDHSQT